MLLIASDIFGNSPETQIQANSLAKMLNIEVQIITPYYTEQRFEDENEAYGTFINAGGIDAYIAKIKQFKKPEKVTYLLGFSAGAAALWCASNMFYKAKQQTLLYPGQIRHYLDLSPQISTQVLLAKYEPTSCVATIAATLASKTMVIAQVTHHSHGFINPQSVGYDKCAADTFLHEFGKGINAINLT